MYLVYFYVFLIHLASSLLDFDIGCSCANKALLVCIFVEDERCLEGRVT